MEKGKQVFLTFFIIFSVIVNTEVVQGHKPKPNNWKRLFVFGDSYADTGNNNRRTDESWMIPYGVSFPGKPDGRWSNGFVLTDYVAKYMRIKTPVAYKSWRNHGLKKLKYGVNFAYGGTGVFTIPGAPYPNMTQQIDLFEQMLKKKVFTSKDLQNSVALVTLAGNDYSNYVAHTANWTAYSVIGFMESLYDQLLINLKRIRSLGVKQVLVANLQPLGCLPRVTESSGYTQCNEEYNSLVDMHNSFIDGMMYELLNGTHTDYQPFIVLDLNAAFKSIFDNKGLPSENLRYENPMAPCCMGLNDNYYCASVEKNGTSMYTLCNDPKKTFFWDRVHPTHEGWRAVSWLLRGALNNITDLPHHSKHYEALLH